MSNDGSTNVEKFSATELLLRRLDQWNHSEKHPKLGRLGVRTVGFAATPLTEVIDALVHSILFISKSATGFVATPYNFTARRLFPNHTLPRDLELSSALVHLAKVIYALFRIIILPLIMLFNPDRELAFYRPRPVPDEENSILEASSDEEDSQASSRSQSESDSPASDQKDSPASSPLIVQSESASDQENPRASSRSQSESDSPVSDQEDSVSSSLSQSESDSDQEDPAASSRSQSETNQEDAAASSPLIVQLESASDQEVPAAFSRSQSESDSAASEDSAVSIRLIVHLESDSPVSDQKNSPASSQNVSDSESPSQDAVPVSASSSHAVTQANSDSETSSDEVDQEDSDSETSNQNLAQEDLSSAVSDQESAQENLDSSTSDQEPAQSVPVSASSNREEVPASLQIPPTRIEDFDRAPSPSSWFGNLRTPSPSAWFGGLRTPSPSAWFGGLRILSPSPKFKQDQNRLILNILINDLTEKYGLIEESHAERYEELLRKIRLSENASSLNNKLIQALIILFNPKFVYEDVHLQRSDFLSKLTEIAGNEEYAALRESDDERICLLHLISHSLVTAPQWDLFEQVINSVTGRETTVVNNEISIVDVIKEDQKAIQAAPSDWKFDMVSKNFRNLQGQIGLGFTPSHDTNYFSALYVETYRDRNGVCKEVPVYRFPTATEDGLWGGSKIVGAMRLWIDHLKGQGLRHCWFGHQNREELYLNREGTRSTALLQLHRENRETFFFFNLPMDGEVFNGKSIELSKFKDIVYEKMLSGEEGFYFPSNALEDFLRGKGIEFNGKNWLNETLDRVHQDFFTDREELSEKERQTFLLLFYTLIEREFCLMLDASRNSTCKDGIDRAGVMNALCYYMNLAAMGKHKDPEHLHQFRIVLHHAAFFVKTQAVIPHRMELLLNTLTHLEKMELQELPSHTLQELPSHTTPDGFRVYSQAHPGSYWSIIDSEPQTQRTFQWSNFVDDIFIGTRGDLQRDRIEVDSFSVPRQLRRDVLTARMIINGRLIRGFGKEKEEREKDAMRQLLKEFSDLTKERSDDAVYLLCCLHTQAVFPSVFELLQTRYNLGDYRFLPRQIPIEGGLVNTCFDTSKTDAGIKVTITSDFEIQNIENSQKRIVRSTLTIKLPSVFRLKDYEPFLYDSQPDLYRSLGAIGGTPDAILTWEVGNPCDFVSMTLDGPITDADGEIDPDGNE